MSSSGLLGRAAATAPSSAEHGAVRPGARRRRCPPTRPPWQGGEIPADWEVEAPPVAAALLARLGQFPFWRGRQPFVEALEPVYHAASARGLEVFLAIPSPFRERGRGEGQ